MKKLSLKKYRLEKGVKIFFKWLQLDSNPEPRSLQRNTQPFGKLVEYSILVAVT